MTFWRHALVFWRRTDGASAAEYVLVLALLGGGIVVALLALTGSMTTAFSDAGASLRGP